MCQCIVVVSSHQNVTYLPIFVDVTPCYGQELPVVDSATGLEYNCGIYGVECPTSSFCHQTANFAKCCPKGRKTFKYSCLILAL